MASFPKDEARAHIQRLERKHEIEVRIVKDKWDSEAHIQTRQVWIPDPTTPLKYLIALHEFGHILDKISAKVMRRSRAECEAAAWRWAIEHGRPELLDCLSPRDWLTVGKAWLTHVTKRSPSIG